MRAKKTVTVLSMAAALSLAGGVGVASADAEGCNHGACINVKGGAGGYQVFGYIDNAVGGGTVKGYFTIVGPNLNFVSPEKQWPLGAANGTAIQYSYGAGQVCVEFWNTTSGGPVSDGKPCEDVS